MTIQQIKAGLSIEKVLSHYGLQANRNQMLKCPFHTDDKPSMKIYKTNTVFCFAGSCDVKSLDVIDFIMKMDRCEKRAAIMKAKEMCGAPIVQTELFQPKVKSKSMSSTTSPAVAFKSYQKSFATNRLAKEYCEHRCLDWQTLEIGYKSQKTTQTYQKGRQVWGRDCIIFPLLNPKGEIINLYGRCLNPNAKGQHYYQTNRQGLYPGYPAKLTKFLILTESIVDAATLQGLDLPVENYAVLSLFGTNGLTPEHLGAISHLVQLEEIIFALDEDPAGLKGVKEHRMTLSRLYPKVKQSRLVLIQEEDINSMAMSHDHKESLFVELVNNRVDLAEKKEIVPLRPVDTTPKPNAILNISDANNLLFATEQASYYVKGGVRCTVKDLAHLKVTLVVANRHGKKSRNGLDLYEDRQVEKTARHIGERLNLRADLVEMDLHLLTDELEKYRQSVIDGKGESAKKSKVISPTERAKYLEFWNSKELLKKIDELLESSGIIGEYNNRRLGFCIAASSQMPDTLHGLIQGSSGSGKTHLLSALCSLIPEEWYISITRATDNSFYNYQEYELRNKLISIEDKDSMSDDANLAFRELQSKGMVGLSTTGQDDHGHNRSYVKNVYGPIASLCCTTKGEQYLDDMNRCFLLAVDESEEQTRRILRHQKSLAAGSIDKSKKEKLAAFMQGALRLLKPLTVIIPQATKINLPEDVKDKRRLNGLYLSLVKQITLLHQHQREKDEAGRLVATKADLRIANEIMFDAIVLKVDDLHGPLRSFYEKLKVYIKEKAGEQAEKYIFRQRELRHAMRLSKTSLFRFFKELLEMEYLQITGGSDRRGYEYKISYWDDNEGLRQRIKEYLQNQINQF